MPKAISHAGDYNDCLMPGEITGYGAWSPVADPAIAGIDDPAP